MADVRTNQTSNVTLYDESGNSAVTTPGSTSSAVVGVQGAQPAATSQTGIIAAAAQTAVAVTGYNVATVTLRTFTGTTPSITWKLQSSDDNTNWVDLQGTNNATGVVSTSFTQGSALAAGTAGPSVDYTIGAYTHIRINVTAISGTSATAAFGIGLQSMPYEATPAAIINGFDGTNYQRIKTDSSGQLILGVSSSLTVQPGNTANTTPWLIRHAAATTSSGLLNAKILSAASTNATSVKGSAGAIYGWHLINNSASTRYVRIFNKATAPTVGTDSPIFVLPLPAFGGAVMTPATMNFALSTGFAYAITGAAADLDTTVVVANDVVGTIWYI